MIDLLTSLREMPRDKIEPLNEAELSALNPGIRSTVQRLREWGFNTADSGDGLTAQYDCDLPCPYVHIVTAPEELVSETERLVNLLNDVGIDFANCPHPQFDPEGAIGHPSVEASYLPLQRQCAAIHLINVILPLSAQGGARAAHSSPPQNQTL